VRLGIAGIAVISDIAGIGKARAIAKIATIAKIVNLKNLITPTAEGGCATRALIAPTFIPRRRGLLYPIKPKPGFHPSTRKSRVLGTPGLNGGPGLRSTILF